MILVIAEKPSVAQSIAKVLGATSRKDGYMEGGNYIVSWCFGHLVELADASSYDERYAKWRYDDLPIVPGEITPPLPSPPITAPTSFILVVTFTSPTAEAEYS